MAYFNNKLGKYKFKVGIHYSDVHFIIYKNICIF